MVLMRSAVTGENGGCCAIGRTDFDIEKLFARLIWQQICNLNKEY